MANTNESNGICAEFCLTLFFWASFSFVILYLYIMVSGFVSYVFFLIGFLSFLFFIYLCFSVCVLKKEWKKLGGVGWVGNKGGSERRWGKRNHCQNKWYEKIVFNTKHILKTLCSFSHAHHWGCSLEKVLCLHLSVRDFLPYSGQHTTTQLLTTSTPGDP